MVYPGHVSGSLCGSNMSEDRSSSIGRERKTNHALRDDAHGRSSRSPPRSRPRSRRRPSGSSRSTAARGCVHGRRSASSRHRARRSSLDVRPVGAFAAGHLPGAISVALDGGSFATRAAFVLDAAEPVVLHAQSRAEADQAAQRLLTSVGLFEQLGYVARWRRAETLPCSRRRSSHAARRQACRCWTSASAGEEPRTDWPSIPYRLLRISPPAGIDPSRPVYTICASGPRATLAASMLVRQGFDARAVVGGGVDDL